MPRAIDLSQAPPAQARCHACGATVELGRRARARGRFRCPHCHSDNRVGPDGVGRPLRGPAEDPARMPQVRCLRCGTANRLPRGLVHRGAYRCWHCRSVEKVPRTLRRRARVGESTLVAVWLVVALGALGACAVRTASALRELRAYGVGDSLAAVQAATRIVDVRAEQPAGGGIPFVVTGELRNVLSERATFYIVAEIREGERLVQSTYALVRNVAVGASQRFEVRLLVDPSRIRDQAVALRVFGVS